MIEQIIHGRFRRLAQELSVYGFHPFRFNKQRIDARNTAFIYLPPVKYVTNAPNGYARCRKLFWCHKRGQRRTLSEFFNVPTRAKDCDPPWVVRPVNHFGGKGFEVAENKTELAAAKRKLGDSYASALFRRTHEFRSYFIGGQHIVTMLKRIDGAGYKRAENIPDPQNDEIQKAPWNTRQQETQYFTIKRERNNKLLNTSFYDDAERFFQQYPLDIISIDAAYNRRDQSYAVFEINFAPGLSIESALEPIAEALQGLR